MKKHILLILVILTTIANISCKAQKKAPSRFLPKGYVVSEKVFEDLNNDGLEDCILIIKQTNKQNIVINRFDPS